MAEEWSHFLIYRDEQFEMAEGDHTLGRSRTCNFSVADPSVSRKHIILVAGPGHILVKDLGSSNGTFINDKKVQGEGILENGDRLRVGDAELTAAVRVKEDPMSFQTMRMAATPDAVPPAAAPEVPAPEAVVTPPAASPPTAEPPAAEPPVAAQNPEAPQPGEATFFLAKESMKLAEALEAAGVRPSKEPASAESAPAEPAPTEPPATFAQPPAAGLQTQRLEAVPPTVGMATTAMSPEQLAELQPLPAADQQPPSAAEPPSMATMAMTPEQVQQLNASAEAVGMATTAMTPEQLASLRAEIAEPSAQTDVRLDAGGATMAITPEQMKNAQAEAAASASQPSAPQPSGESTAIEMSFANLDDAESAVGISESGTAIPAPNFSDLVSTPEPPPTFAAESAAESFAPEPPPAVVDPPTPIVEPSFDQPVPAAGPEPPPSFDQPVPAAGPAPPPSFDQPMAPAAPPMSFDQPTPPAAVPTASEEDVDSPEEPAFSFRQPSSAGDLLPSLEDIDPAIGGPEMQPPDMDDSVSLPAAEAVDRQNAGFGIRLLAVLLDALWATALGVASIGPAKTLTADPTSLLWVVSTLVALIVFIGWSYFGTTPGKRVLGLYIHGRDGQAGIGFICAILRMVGYLFSTILVLAGFLMIAFRQDRRGLHDHLAGTNVLRHD